MDLLESNYHHIKKKEDTLSKKSSLLIIWIFFIFSTGLTSADTLFLGPDSFQKSNNNTFVDITSKTITAYSDLEYELYAPIQLPDGAKINSVVIFHYDNNVNSHIEVKIVRENRYDNSTQTVIPMWASTDSSTNPKVTKRTNVNYTYNKILTASCTYHVKLNFVPETASPDYTNLKFYGIKIFYTPPTS